MHRICNEAIETFRGDLNRHNRCLLSSSDSSDPNGMGKE
jgi:hypothetical protein